MAAEEDLFGLSRQLIDFIRQILKTLSEDNPQKKVWTEVNGKLQNILKYYKDNNNETSFAEVQVSLSKNLDYSTEWMNPNQLSNFNHLVSQIVSLSLQMITPFKPGTVAYRKCGCQDKACLFGPLGNRFKPTGDLIVKYWPILPAKEAVNFLFRPNFKTLQKGDKLFRVVGKNNFNKGPWWILDALPNNKTEWRSDLAVPIAWNLNEEYVEFIVYEPLRVWIGIAASQRVPQGVKDSINNPRTEGILIPSSEKNKSDPKEKCILLGGGEQVWIDPNDLKNISLQRKNTNWPKV